MEDKMKLVKLLEKINNTIIEEGHYYLIDNGVFENDTPVIYQANLIKATSLLDLLIKYRPALVKQKFLNYSEFNKFYFHLIDIFGFEYPYDPIEGYSVEVEKHFLDLDTNYQTLNLNIIITKFIAGFNYLYNEGVINENCN